MNVVIAGGTGTIGRALVKHLFEQQYQITILSRNPDKYISTFPPGISFQAWDGKTVGQWTQAIEGSGVVINFAGENLAGDGYLPERWTDAKKKRILDSRLDSGRAIVDAIRSVTNKPEALIQASAIGYYGPRGDEPLDESEPPGEDFLASTSVEWENCTKEVESFGIRRVIVRTGLIQSLEGGPLMRLYLPYKLYGGAYFGDGKQYWSWIHMDDEVRAIQHLIEHEDAQGPFNLTAPEPVTCREFGKVLGKVMNRPSYMPIPRFAMELVLGEVSTVVFDGQRVIPKRLKELGFSFQFNELEAALDDTING
jgi:uncharacterized protein (TIGR01777 family)